LWFECISKLTFAMRVFVWIHLLSRREGSWQDKRCHDEINMEIGLKNTFKMHDNNNSYNDREVVSYF
jgi:hypothetical protein